MNILGIFLALPTATAITRECYISNIAEKDTYVDTANPTSNFGGVDYIIPVHTENPNWFKEHFDKVHLLKEGEKISFQ